MEDSSTIGLQPRGPITELLPSGASGSDALNAFLNLHVVIRSPGASTCKFVSHTWTRVLLGKLRGFLELEGLGFVASFPGFSLPSWPLLALHRNTNNATNRQGAARLTLRNDFPSYYRLRPARNQARLNR